MTQVELNLVIVLYLGHLRDMDLHFSKLKTILTIVTVQCALGHTLSTSNFFKFHLL